jgi:hypothetical protein
LIHSGKKPWNNMSGYHRIRVCIVPNSSRDEFRSIQVNMAMPRFAFCAATSAPSDASTGLGADLHAGRTTSYRQADRRFRTPHRSLRKPAPSRPSRQWTSARAPTIIAGLIAQQHAHSEALC